MGFTKAVCALLAEPLDLLTLITSMRVSKIMQNTKYLFSSIGIEGKW